MPKSRGTRRARGGCGVLLTGAGTNNNRVLENKVAKSDWGFLVNANSSGNALERNHLSNNTRAGIALGSGASGNLIVENNAAGNGRENLAPSLTFDLFDNTTAGTNTWLRNKGTANFPIESVGRD